MMTFAGHPTAPHHAGHFVGCNRKCKRRLHSQGEDHGRSFNEEIRGEYEYEKLQEYRWVGMWKSMIRTTSQKTRLFCVHVHSRACVRTRLRQGLCQNSAQNAQHAQKGAYPITVHHPPPMDCLLDSVACRCGSHGMPAEFPVENSSQRGHTGRWAR